MNRLKQGMAAIALVTSLGLAAPGSFGESVFADISEHNPNRVTTTFHCDLDGNGSFETKYDLISTGSSTMWQDKASRTVLVQRLADLQYSTYEVVNNPTGTANDFFEPTGYWSPVPQAANYPHGQQKGLRTVVCEEVVQYPYSPYQTDCCGHLNDVALVPDFVQSPDCPEDPDAIDGAREDLPECVTYLETDTWHYDVTLSAKPDGAAKSASVGSSGKHHQKGHHKGDKGKHGH